MVNKFANQFLEGLNPAQQKAVQQTEGPLLILAGAGSGKTKTLIQRIAYILASELAGADQVLAVTFTNKASNEMRQRIYRLLKPDEPNDAPRQFMPFMGTFHSVCHRILRIATASDDLDLKSNFVIYDQADAQQLIRQLLRRLHLSPIDFKPSALLAYISQQKNDLPALNYDDDWQQTAKRVYKLYQSELKAQSAVDFDDLILLTVQLLESAPDIRKSWQARFKYVMVDEYQDTNSLQYRLVKLLTPTSGNLAVVGDDWQSIYNWRGADYKIILNFDQDYPNATVVKLEQNYRSTKNILDAAHAVIAKNQLRSKKKLVTDNGDGQKIKLLTIGNARSEAIAVAEIVQSQLQDQGRNYQDFAIFYRTNAQSRSLEEQLMRHNIPYRIYGGTRFYDRQEIKDILAYLRLIYQPDDRLSFDRVVNLPPRGLGAKSLQTLFGWLSDMGFSLNQALAQIATNQSLSPTAKQSLTNFSTMLQELRQKMTTATPAELIEFLLEATNYLDYLKDGGPQGEARIENVQELIAQAEDYNQLGLAAFLEEAALLSSNDQATGSSSNQSVSLMTLHAAKGLEFPVVFMTGMEEELLPHVRAIYQPGDDSLAEERRLCYVGMTRAKEDLYLTCASQRQLHGQTKSTMPSRFLSDIPQQLLEHSSLAEDYNLFASDPVTPAKPTTPAHDFDCGDQVSHNSFGDGTVTAIDGDNLIINFAEVGTKTINTGFAKLEKH